MCILNICLTFPPLPPPTDKLLCVRLKGSNIQKILKILEVLDTHSFYSCQSHNPLTILYCKLAAVQKATEVSVHPVPQRRRTCMNFQWLLSWLLHK